MRGAAEALRRLRELGIATGIVSNQSGVARGLLTTDDVEAWPARRRTARPVRHSPVLPARRRRRVPLPQARARHGRRRGRRRSRHPQRLPWSAISAATCRAAIAAGACILVPTPVTRPEEVAAAPEVTLTWAKRSISCSAVADEDPAVRLDSDGDVLLAGRDPRPCRGRQRHAAVQSAWPATPAPPRRRRRHCVALPMDRGSPDAVDPVDVDALVARLRTTNLDEAVVFTSFHQSALPTALLLRLALGYVESARSARTIPGAARRPPSRRRRHSGIGRSRARARALPRRGGRLPVACA